MTRLAMALSVGLLVLAPGVAHASAAVPPDLAALEQQLATLQVNSERFSLQEELTFGDGLLGQGIPLVLIVAGEGEASASPPQATITAGLAGINAEQIRMIGETVYRHDRSAAGLDGGRPWVRARRKPSEADPTDPSGILGNDTGATHGTFGKLIEELGTALSIEESGPVTVDDQRVIEFDAVLDPTPILRKLEAQGKQRGRPPGSSSPFQLPSVGGPNSKPKPPAPAPSLKLELFLAPSGLPVRVRLTFAAQGVIVSLRVDTLAIGVPVHVVAPPARQTIGEAALKRLERRREARVLKRVVRACLRHVHGRRRAKCRSLGHPRVTSSSQIRGGAESR
jgi:hypothetical protein